MSVHSFRELARTGSHLIGSSPEFERRLVVTLNDPNTPAATVVVAVGADHGASHPDVPAAKCFNLEVNEAYEGNRYWVEVVARYKIPAAEEQSITLLPWLRPDVWKFVTQGVAVPALFYYAGNGNDDQDRRPLVNSAGDYFQGLSVDEAQQKITITANREAFPSDLAAAVTNCVNASSYLGFPQDCVKVQGIAGEQVVEMVGGQEVRYWKITSELLARQTGWNLLLPDIGFNYILNNQKRRADVLGPEGEMVASANPIALNGIGGKQPALELPAILTRRIYKRINMADWFGTPPV